MLKRILEPEVMDTPDEARAYDAMDHAEVNRTFVDDLLGFASRGDGDESFSGDVIDVGAGTARIPVELCRRMPDVRVVAIDLSESMLDLARSHLDVESLAERITLARIDAKELPYEDGQFAAVISNSIVHHIPEPAGPLAEAVRVCAPGRVLFFRDLLRPPDDAAVKRLVHRYAGSKNEQQQKLFDDSLRASLTLAEIRGIVGRLGFDPKTVRTTSDRHWTWAVRKMRG